jgi:hypothetical protein
MNPGKIVLFYFILLLRNFCVDGSYVILYDKRMQKL